jgi:hypothetical protein
VRITGNAEMVRNGQTGTGAPVDAEALEEERQCPPRS